MIRPVIVKVLTTKKEKKKEIKKQKSTKPNQNLKIIKGEPGRGEGEHLRISYYFKTKKQQILSFLLKQIKTFSLQ